VALQGAIIGLNAVPGVGWILSIGATAIEANYGQALYDYIDE
jgi:hypothetical protein